MASKNLTSARAIRDGLIGHLRTKHAFPKSRYFYRDLTTAELSRRHRTDHIERLTAAHTEKSSKLHLEWSPREES